MDKQTILIADDDWEATQQLEARLAEAGYETHVARDGYAALSKARVVLPDIILLDVMIRGMRGVEVKSRLTQEESTINIPVIFITDKSVTDEKVRDFVLKADGFVAKPFDFKELFARLEAVSSRRKLYEQIYMTDPITGLNNVHIFKRTLNALFNIAKRYGRVFSVTVMDVNDFKHVNDTYGHAVGDAILRVFAEAMKKIFRDTDVLIRYGGDEFVVLFPETDQAQAVEAVRRLKSAVKNSHIPIHSGQETIGFSIAAGVASYRKDSKRAMEFFELADKNMYLDKSESKMTAKKPAAMRRQ